jgi:hypothetical protein
MPLKTIVFLALAAAASAVPAMRSQPDKQVASRSPEAKLVKGQVFNEQTGAPLASRMLLFVATTNRCPDSCSCGTGTCAGDPNVCKGVCVYGSIARTNKDGFFGIRLPLATYDIHLQPPPIGKPIFPPVVVDAKFNEEGSIVVKVPAALVGDAEPRQ